MKLIPLTQGKFAMVDDEDFEGLNKHKWCAVKIRRTFYAVRRASRPERGLLYMHRVITGALPEQEPDHADGDGLNNQGHNLELGDRQSNARSLRKTAASASSEYRGISWDKNARCWRARIEHAGRKYHIGLFADDTAAALAFDAKARELGWPESGLNFPKHS